MSVPKRKTYDNHFKVKVVLAVLKGDRTLSQIVKQFSVSTSMIHLWKKTFLENINNAFPDYRSGKAGSNKCNCGISEKEAENLYAKIGKLEIKNDFLVKKL
jgi:transposase